MTNKLLALSVTLGSHVTTKHKQPNIYTYLHISTHIYIYLHIVKRSVTPEEVRKRMRRVLS